MKAKNKKMEYKLWKYIDERYQFAIGLWMIIGGILMLLLSTYFSFAITVTAITSHTTIQDCGEMQALGNPVINFVLNTVPMAFITIGGILVVDAWIKREKVSKK